MRVLAQAFAIDVFGYAVMSNHLHVVACTRPSRAATWDAETIARQWALVYPCRDEHGQPKLPDRQWLADRCRDQAWIDERRRRLSSISWFMKALKEPIARRANREDGCTGSFWEGRFAAVALLDQAAVISCMAYVDLNPIRAGMAATPEASLHTSIKQRIDLRLQPNDTDKQPPRCTPLPNCLVDDSDPNVESLALDRYLTLVDQLGRMIANGKRGVIPDALPPIAERLGLDGTLVTIAMSSPGQMRGTAIGSLTARTTEAARRGRRWIADKFRCYRPPQQAP